MKKLITRLVATLALALVAFTPDIASAGRGLEGWMAAADGAAATPGAAARVWRGDADIAAGRALRLGLGRMVGPWRRHLDRRLWTPLLVPDLRLLSLPLPLGLLAPANYFGAMSSLEARPRARLRTTLT